MRNIWKAKQISKEMGKLSGFAPKNEVFDRVWFKLENRLADRKKHFWGSIVWKPWARPGGRVLLAACLCLALTGVHYQQNQADNKDLASYLMALSNPVLDSTHDDNFVKLSRLLTGPSAEITDNPSSDEDQVNVLQGDEIFL